MREIKFRAWFEDAMLSNEQLINMDQETHAMYTIITNEKKEDGTAFMQYTGLKDKNSREIYMKDIVKREFEVWQTVWEGSLERNNLAPTEEFVCAGYFIGVVSQTPQGLYVLNQCNKFDEDGHFIQKRSNVKLYAHRCEVIGNVYENPELLEVQE